LFSGLSARRPFERLRDRERLAKHAEDSDADVAQPASADDNDEVRKVKPSPTDKVFPSSQRELFNAVLGELNLKHDRDGNVRTTYSLRHTYICFRLMEGADIYQIAKNCRTSVEMIEKFYAAHIKTMLDASAIKCPTGHHPQGARDPRRRARPSGPDGPKSPRRRIKTPAPKGAKDPRERAG
jgi:hypothetical protein